MRNIAYVLIALCAGAIIILITNKARNNPRVVFCDVGQGDATYIRLPEKIDVLIDTGPGRQILECINDSLPLFDRTIELLILTHPQKDHVGALSLILDNYEIKQVITSGSLQTNHEVSEIWEKIRNKLSIKNIPMDYLYAGTTIRLARSRLSVIWPEKNYKINDKTNVNNIGIALIVSINGYRLLLPADVDYPIIERSLKRLKGNVDILKIGHHGSKTATSLKLLQIAGPSLSVISAGKFNPYGHPHKNVLELLQSLKILTKRTDELGSIVVNLDPH